MQRQMPVVNSVVKGTISECHICIVATSVLQTGQISDHRFAISFMGMAENNPSTAGQPTVPGPHRRHGKMRSTKRVGDSKT